MPCKARKTLFLTGRLAAPSLRGILGPLDNEAGRYAVLELPISVAALMTTEWLLKQLTCANLDEYPDELVIPGRCKVNPSALSDAICIPVRVGPDDLWDIPAWLGITGAEASHDLVRGPTIIAEIVDAWSMSVEAILHKARAFRTDGADYIDLGGNPETGIPDVARKVAALKAAGFSVSVDTFHEGTILEACRAGADIILSINSRNMGLLEQISCPVVILPDDDYADTPQWRTSLERNMQAARKCGIDAIADPILSPPLMGLVPSLCRYLSYREENPYTPMLMGAGNVTELLEADSAGVNAMLAACISELGVDYVLTTEVAYWTRGTLRELTAACRIMGRATAHGILPRRVDNGLCELKGPPAKYGHDELRAMQRALTDHNWRIFVSEGAICVFNRATFLTGNNPQELYGEMRIADPTHAFYLGGELQKAAIAVQLGKRYVQDDSLTWGVLT